jgi:hypothetical protein
MASNLRKKIPKESTLYINDVDTAAIERFVKEFSSVGPVKVLNSAKEITEHSVLEHQFVHTDNIGRHFLDCAQRISCQERLFRREDGCDRSETRQGRKTILRNEYNRN